MRTITLFIIILLALLTPLIVDATSYQYWRQDDDTTKVWIKGNWTTTSKRIFWSNTSSTYSSDGTRVFLFFDNFAGSSINTSKWSVTNNGYTYNVSAGMLHYYNPNTANRYFNVVTLYNYSFPNRLLTRASISMGTGNTLQQIELTLNSTSKSYTYLRELNDYSYTNANTYIYHTSCKNSVCTYGSQATYGAQAWKIWQYMTTSSKAVAKLDNAYIGTNITNVSYIPTINLHGRIRSNTHPTSAPSAPAYNKVDYFLITNYNFTEPTITCNQTGNYCDIVMSSGSLTNYQIILTNTDTGNLNVYDNQPPTIPTDISGFPASLKVGNVLNVTASGSTDPDGDSITYYYKFYNVNDAVIKQNYSTTKTYTIQSSDAHNTIKVYAKAVTASSNSSEYNETDFVDNTNPTTPSSSSFTGTETNDDLVGTVSGSTDADGDSRYYVYDWKLNSNSFAILNMPMTYNQSTTKVNDYSTYNNYGTLSGGAYFNRTGGKYSRGSYHFDGTGDYIALDPLADQIVVNGSLILGYTPTDNSKAAQYVFSMREGTSDRFYVRNDAGQLDIGWLTTLGYEPGYNFTVNVPVLIYLNWTGDKLSVYVDDVYKATHDDTGDISDVDTACIACLSSAKSTTTYHAIGDVWLVQAFSKSLTSAQRTQLYTNYSIIKSNELVVGQNWSLRGFAVDSYGYNSSNKTSVIKTITAVSNTPPTDPTALAGIPWTAYVGTVVNVTASGSTDAEGDPITYQYSFYNVNESVYRQTYSTTKTYTIQAIDAHDVIRVRAMAYDGELYSSHYEESDSIDNSIPTTPSTLTVNGGVSSIYEGNTFTSSASGSTDADGDSITYYYQFYNINDSNIRQAYSTTNSYYGHSLSPIDDRGDKIRVDAKGYDGYGYSTLAKSSNITITKILRTMIDTSDSVSKENRYYGYISNISGTFNLLYLGDDSVVTTYTPYPVGLDVISSTSTIFGYGEYDDKCIKQYDGILELKYMCEAGEDSDKDGSCEAGETCIYYSFTPSYIDVQVNWNMIGLDYYLDTYYLDGSIDGHFLYENIIGVGSGYVTTPNYGYVINNITTEHKIINLYNNTITANQYIYLKDSSTTFDNVRIGSTSADNYMLSGITNLRYQIFKDISINNNDGIDQEAMYDYPLSDSRATEEMIVSNFTMYIGSTNTSKKYEYGATVPIHVEGNIMTGYEICLYDSLSNSELDCTTNTDLYYNYSSPLMSYHNTSTGATSIALDMLRTTPENKTVVKFVTDYSKCSDIDAFTLNIEGFTYFETDVATCEDISIDLFNDSIIDISLPGYMGGRETAELYDSYLVHAKFTNGLNKENLTFTSDGTVIRYLNYSTYDAVDTTKNLTLKLSGYTLGTENVFVEDLLYNDSLIYSTNGTAPEFILDDFTGSSPVSNWDTEPTSDWDTDLTDGGSYLSMTNYESATVQDTSYTNSNTVTYSTLDLSDYNQVQARIKLTNYVRDTGIDCHASSVSQINLVDSNGTIYRIGQNPTLTDSVTSNYDHTYTIQFRDDGGIYVDDVYITNRDTEQEYYLSIYGYTLASRNFWSCTAISSLTSYVYGINASGFTVDYKSNMTYNNTAKYSFISDLLHTTTANVTRAMVDVDVLHEELATLKIYLSNNNGSTYEETSDGIYHSFTSAGKKLRVKFVLNTSSTTTPTIIKDYSLNVLQSNITNISIDIGNDGSTEYTFASTLTPTNSPRNVTINSTYVLEYLLSSACADQLTCNIPIAFSSDTAGILGVHNIRGIQDYNSIDFNESFIDDWLDTHCNDSTKCNWTVSFVRSVNGDITTNTVANAITHSYICDTDTTLTANVSTYPGGVLLDETSLNLGFRYSPFTVEYPSGIEYYDLMPKTYNSKNVQPYGQASGKPIFNISSQAKTDGIDVIVCLNETLDSCLDIWWSTYYNMTAKQSIDSTGLCESYINLTDGMITSQGFYNMWNLTSCTSNAFKYLEYNLVFDSWCDDCVRDCRDERDCGVDSLCSVLDECIGDDFYHYPEKIYYTCEEHQCTSNTYPEFCTVQEITYDSPECV